MGNPTIHISSVSHSQTNGQTETMNKIIISKMKKRLEDAKGKWLEELYSVLWSIRTTASSRTRDTPFYFNLAFGSDGVFLVKIGIYTLRINTVDNVDNDELLRYNLDLLDETREDDQVRAAARHKKVARFYNKRVKPHSFEEGDLVMRSIITS